MTLLHTKVLQILAGDLEKFMNELRLDTPDQEVRIKLRRISMAMDKAIAAHPELHSVLATARFKFLTFGPLTDQDLMEIIDDLRKTRSV